MSNAIMFNAMTAARMGAFRFAGSFCALFTPVPPP